jgi:hypothetical protein
MAYDWLLIKREYVQGYPDEDGQIICPTLEQLCERHGCSLSTIMKKSASEKWPTERKLFGRKKEEKIEEKKIEVLAEESASIDNKVLNAADIGIDKGLSFLADKTLSIHDFNKVSRALSTFHRMGKLALGEPTEHTQTTGKTMVDVSIHDRINQAREYFDQLDESREGSGDGDNNQ